MPDTSVLTPVPIGASFCRRSGGPALPPAGMNLASDHRPCDITGYARMPSKSPASGFILGADVSLPTVPQKRPGGFFAFQGQRRNPEPALRIRLAHPHQPVRPALVPGPAGGDRGRGGSGRGVSCPATVALTRGWRRILHSASIPSPDPPRSNRPTTASCHPSGFSSKQWVAARSVSAWPNMSMFATSFNAQVRWRASSNCLQSGRRVE